MSYRNVTVKVTIENPETEERVLLVATAKHWYLPETRESPEESEFVDIELISEHYDWLTDEIIEKAVYSDDAEVERI